MAKEDAEARMQAALDAVGGEMSEDPLDIDNAADSTGTRPDTDGQTQEDAKEGDGEVEDGGDEKDGKDGAEDAPDLTTLQRRTAAQFEIDDDQIAQWGDKAADILDQMGRQYSRAMGKLGRKSGDTQPAGRDADGGTGEPKRGKAQGGTSEGGSDTPPALADLTASDMLSEDPANHNQHRALTRTLLERVAALETRATQEQQQQNQRAEARFFRAFTDDYPGVKMSSGLREKIAEEASAIRAGFAANGQQITVLESLERAASYLTIDDIRRSDRDGVRRQVEQRRQQRSHRPATRHGERTTRTAEQVAFDKLDAAARRIGIPLAD